MMYSNNDIYSLVSGYKEKPQHKTILQNYFKPFNKNSLELTLSLFLANIIFYKLNLNKIKLYDDYTIFTEAKDKEEFIKKWKKEIRKNIKDMQYIEIRYLYDYQHNNETKTGATSYYYKLPKHENIEPDKLKKEAQNLKNQIIKWEQELTKGHHKNRKIHSISISIAPRKEIPYTTDKKGNKKPKAGNSKTATAFNYFLLDIDIEEWKKPNYEPTQEEINKHINNLLNALPEKAYKPHIIGYTGAGLRFIWYFTRPITRLEIPLLKKIAQDLREKTNMDVDDRVYDISRVDRILGTENRKTKYGTPRQSRILYYNPNAIGYILEKFYDQVGYGIKEVMEIIEKEQNKTSEDTAIEVINKLKKNNTIQEFKSMDEKTYKKTKRIQKILHEKGKKKHNNNYGWIIDLLNYLGIGYKPAGNRIHIYSIYTDDGNNPDTAIYINQGYNAIVKDFHLDTSFNLIAYLWTVYEHKILEYLKINGLCHSLEDNNNIYEVINEFFELETEKIPLERYITPKHIKRIIENNEHKTIGIKAPTGSGKTTAIINYAVENNKKIIFLVPYYSMALQQATQNKLKGFIGLHQDHNEKNETIKKTTRIIATYDQLQKIVDIKGADNIKEYMLIIDEYHNLITQYDLRYNAINTIIDYKEAFSRVVYLSGTYEGLNIENTKIYEFKPKYQRKNNYIISTCKNNEGLEYLLNELKEIDTTTGKYLVFVNNIETIREIKEKLEEQGIEKIYTLTALNKHNEIMETIANEEKLKETGVYITTSVICDGINLKDKDVKKIYIYKVQDIYQMGQYIARVRNTEPDIIHIIEPKKIDNIETYKDFMKSTTELLKQIVDPINKNRIEAMEQGINLDEYYIKELKRLPIYEEEKFIKYNKYTKLYDIDYFKMTKAYLDRLNPRIMSNPKAIQQALLKFYPKLNIKIEQAKLKELNEKIEPKENTKDKLVKYLIKHDYDTIKEIKQYKGKDELKLVDKTGINDIQEIMEIKEVAKRHHKSLKTIERVKEYENYGIKVEINKKDINTIKEKYNIPESMEEKAKEIYIITANPKAIGKKIKVWETAKAIILDKQGKIKKDNHIILEGWQYTHIKIILDELMAAWNKEKKNINIPILLSKLRDLPKPKVKKTKREIIISKIKEYAKIKKVGEETYQIIEIAEEIIEAYNWKVKKANKVKNYLEILKEHTGEQLHEEDILKLLDNNKKLFETYKWEGYLINVKKEWYIIDI
jgi:hypothetical protein